MPWSRWCSACVRSDPCTSWRTCPRSLLDRNRPNPGFGRRPRPLLRVASDSLEPGWTRTRNGHRLYACGCDSPAGLRARSPMLIPLDCASPPIGRRASTVPTSPDDGGPRPAAEYPTTVTWSWCSGSARDPPRCVGRTYSIAAASSLHLDVRAVRRAAAARPSWETDGGAGEVILSPRTLSSRTREPPTSARAHPWRRTAGPRGGAYGRVRCRLSRDCHLVWATTGGWNSPSTAAAVAGDNGAEQLTSAPGTGHCRPDFSRSNASRMRPGLPPFARPRRLRNTPPAAAPHEPRGRAPCAGSFLPPPLHDPGGSR